MTRRPINYLSVVFLCVGFAVLIGWAILMVNLDRLDSGMINIVLFRILPPFLTLAVIALLLVPASAKINLILIAVSSLAGLFLVDTATAIYDNSPYAREMRDRLRRQEAASTFNLPYDGRSRAEVIFEQRRSGRAVMPPIYPTNLLSEAKDGFLHSVIRINGKEVLPLGGISHTDHVFCNEIGPWIFYKSDRYGLNNPSTIWPDPTDGTARVNIAAIGDSFTHGACVPAHSHMITMIRERFPKTLNLGGSGIGPLSQLSSLREYGPIAKPRIVLWFYFEGNDLADLDLEKRVPLLRRYLARGFRQDLPGQQATIDKALGVWIENKIRQSASQTTELLPTLQIRDILLLRHLRHKLGIRVFAAPRSQLPPPDLELFRQISIEIRETVAAWGGRVILVYLPDIFNFCGVSTDLDCRRAPGEFRRQHAAKPHLMEIARNTDLEILDVLPKFAELKRPLSAWTRIDGHYSPAGYRLVATAVLDRLTGTQGQKGPKSARQAGSK